MDQGSKRVRNIWQLGAGFTLIELVVVLAISTFLVAGGIAAYTNFNERQLVTAEGLKLYNDIRLTQGKASANEKPVSCAQGGLEGYQLRFTSDRAYVIEALCNGVAVDIGISQTLATGVTLASGNQVVFRILGRGSDPQIFCLSGFGRFYSMSVTSSGEVVDSRMVSSC